MKFKCIVMKNAQLIFYVKCIFSNICFTTKLEEKQCHRSKEVVFQNSKK